MQIDDLRERLAKRRDELRVRVNRVGADLRRELDPLVNDFADQAIQRSNDDVLGAIRVSAEDELRQIGVALQRIEEHRYDVCARCGGTIGVDRLAAVPYTDLCATCAIAGTARS
jgi:RNA polymerase-binding transcription factor DksA